MATHTVLVPSYIGGEVKKTGSLVEYTGAPNWKFQPVDEAELAVWQEQTADPARVEEHLMKSRQW